MILSRRRRRQRNGKTMKTRAGAARLFRGVAAEVTYRGSLPWVTSAASRGSLLPGRCGFQIEHSTPNGGVGANMWRRTCGILGGGREMRRLGTIRNDAMLCYAWLCCAMLCYLLLRCLRCLSYAQCSRESRARGARAP